MKRRTLEPCSNGHCGSLAIVLSLIIAAGFVPVRRRRAQPRVERAARRARGLRAHRSRRPPASAQREKRHSNAREYIDDANDILLKPFAGVASTRAAAGRSALVPTVLGLLVYGFLLAYLARFMATAARLHRDRG